MKVYRSLLIAFFACGLVGACATPQPVKETARLVNLHTASLNAAAVTQRSTFNASRRTAEESAANLFQAQAPRRDLVSHKVTEWKDKIAFGDENSLESKKLKLFLALTDDTASLKENPFAPLTNETLDLSYGQISRPDLSGLVTITNSMEALQKGGGLSLGDWFSFASSVNSELADLEKEREKEANAVVPE